MPSVCVSIRRAWVCPIMLKTTPTTILGLATQKEGLNDHIVIPIGGDLAAADAASHCNVEQDRHVSHGPRALWDRRLHDGSAIDVPDHPALSSVPAGLIPGEVVPHWAGVHVGDLGADDAMLLLLVVEAPVQTGSVLVIAVPGFRNVDLAVYGPGKGFLREKPEGGPDALGAGRQNDAREDSSISSQGLPAHQPGRGVSLLCRRCGVLGNGADHETAILGAAQI